MSKKILITGGLGFMGSNFIRRLYNLYPDYKIINYDLITYAGNLDNLKDIEKKESGKSIKDKRYIFIKGDICDFKKLDKLLLKEKIDTIVNFAAESHVDRSLVNSIEFVRTNITGVHVLLNLVQKYHINKFIQISTDEIYGDVDKGKSHELSHIRPSNPYSASKAAADLLIQSYIRSYATPAIIVRGSNNFGPYQYPEKLIPLAITNLIEGNPIPIHGNGEHVRTWIYVEDFCRGVDVVMHRAAHGEIYNIAGTQEKNIDVIKRIAQILKKKFKSVVTYANDRPGADMRYAPNASKITREFGWKPEHFIMDSLPSVVDWYLKNETWWKAVKEKRVFLDHYEKQRRGQYY